jgi:arsenate reductase
MIELVGLKNCDSCRTASRWLDGEDIAFRFRDIRESPPSAKELKTWLAAVGADRLVNRRSTTWRKLSDADRGRAETTQVAALLSANPTLIKRPVIIKDSQVMVGFDTSTQSACRT